MSNLQPAIPAAQLFPANNNDFSYPTLHHFPEGCGPFPVLPTANVTGLTAGATAVIDYEDTAIEPGAAYLVRTPGCPVLWQAPDGPMPIADQQSKILGRVVGVFQARRAAS